MAENLDVNLNKNCESHDLFSQRDTSEFESFREVADHELDHWLFAINKSKIRFLLDGKIKEIGHGDGREIRNQRNKRVYFLWFALNVGLNCKECRARYRYKFQIEREMAMHWAFTFLSATCPKAVFVWILAKYLIVSLTFLTNQLLKRNNAFFL